MVNAINHVQMANKAQLRLYQMNTKFIAGCAMRDYGTEFSASFTCNVVSAVIG